MLTINTLERDSKFFLKKLTKQGAIKNPSSGLLCIFFKQQPFHIRQYNYQLSSLRKVAYDSILTSLIHS